VFLEGTVDPVQDDRNVYIAIFVKLTADPNRYTPRKRPPYILSKPVRTLPAISKACVLVITIAEQRIFLPHQIQQKSPTPL
jgi:hypothetical protein